MIDLNIIPALEHRFEAIAVGELEHDALFHLSSLSVFQKG
jgi:hypothetical protein